MISPFLHMNFMSTPVQTSCQMDLNSRWGAEEHLSLAVILSLLCARPHHGFDAPNPTVSLHFLANVPLQSKTYHTIENAPNMLLVISCSIPQRSCLKLGFIRLFLAQNPFWTDQPTIVDEDPMLHVHVSILVNDTQKRLTLFYIVYWLGDACQP